MLCHQKGKQVIPYPVHWFTFVILTQILFSSLNYIFIIFYLESISPKIVVDEQFKFDADFFTKSLFSMMNVQNHQIRNILYKINPEYFQFTVDMVSCFEFLYNFEVWMMKINHCIVYIHILVKSRPFKVSIKCDQSNRAILRYLFKQNSCLNIFKQNISSHLRNSVR